MSDKIDIQSLIDQATEQIAELESYIKRNKAKLAENLKDIQPEERLNEFVRDYILRVAPIEEQLIPEFLTSSVYRSEFNKLKNDLIQADKINRLKLEDAETQLKMRQEAIKLLNMKQQQDQENAKKIKKKQRKQKKKVLSEE